MLENNPFERFVKNLVEKLIPEESEDVIIFNPITTAYHYEEVNICFADRRNESNYEFVVDIDEARSLLKELEKAIREYEKDEEERNDDLAYYGRYDV